MKILIAEDDAVSSAVLQRMLKLWDHEAVVCSDGKQAWEILQREDSPKLAILDWMMPEIDGVELCRRVKRLGRREPPYLILVTAKSQQEDVIFGLESGADDYVTKPFSVKELSARIRVGERTIRIQSDLSQRIAELEWTTSEVSQLTAQLLRMTNQAAESQVVAT